MKKLNVLLSIFVLLLAANAFAQLDPDLDGIGIYFDAEATLTCAYTSVPFESVTAYLCITNPTDATGVSGWEATIVSAGPAVAPAWTLASGLDVDASADGSRSVSAVARWLSKLLLPSFSPPGPVS